MSFIKHNPIPVHPVKDAAAILLWVAFFISEDCDDLVTSKNKMVGEGKCQTHTALYAAERTP